MTRPPLHPLRGLVPGVRARLFVALAVFGAVCLAALLFTQLRARREQIMQGGERGALALLTHTAPTLARLYALGDRVGVQQAVTRLVTTRVADAAMVLDGRGVVEAGSDSSWIGRSIDSLSCPRMREVATLAVSSHEPLAVFTTRHDGLAAAAIIDGPRALTVRDRHTLDAWSAVHPAQSPATLAPRRLVLSFVLTPRLAAARRGVLRDDLLLALAYALGILGLWFYTDSRIARPAQRIAEAAERLAAGDLTARTGLRGDEGVSAAGESFDRMASRIETSERDLHGTRALLDTVLASLPVGVVCVSRYDQRLIFANQRWRDLFGIPAEVGETMLPKITAQRLQHTNGDPFPQERLAVPTVIRTGRAADVSDLVYIRSDGERIPVLVSAMPVALEGGSEFDSVVAVIQDRRDVERSFRERLESERRFALVAESTLQVFYEWDTETHRVRAGDTVTSVFGYPPARTDAPYDFWIDAIHPDDRPRVLAAFVAALRRRQDTYDLVYRVRRADGTWRTVRNRGRYEWAPDGRARRAMGTLADITEQHDLEQQLRQAQKMETIGTLAGGVAHDFNNQLTGVLGHLDLLAAEIDAKDARQEHVHLATVAAQRCAELTRGLLAFSRRLDSHPRRLVLDDVVQESVALLSRTLPRGLRLTTSLAPEPWAVMADPLQVQQVLMNLCVNARDAMREGGELHLWTRNVTLDPEARRRHPALDSDHVVELGVSDTGQGIASDVLPRIFEPFFTTKSPGEGTGLGLAMAYGIVSGHHGWIDVESTPGVGTTFRVYLPRTRTPDAAPDTPAREPAPGGSETLLVVDDEPAVREVVSRVLSAAGYRVLAARDGDEALALFRAGHAGIQGIVLDVSMPGRSGWQVLDELMLIDRGARVLMSSGYSESLGPTLNLRGAAGFLAKPYRNHDLLREVRRMLDATARAATGTV